MNGELDGILKGEGLIGANEAGMGGDIKSEGCEVGGAGPAEIDEGIDEGFAVGDLVMVTGPVKGGVEECGEFIGIGDSGEDGLKGILVEFLAKGTLTGDGQAELKGAAVEVKGIAAFRHRDAEDSFLGIGAECRDSAPKAM